MSTINHLYALGEHVRLRIAARHGPVYVPAIIEAAYTDKRGERRYDVEFIGNARRRFTNVHELSLFPNDRQSA